MKKIKKNILLKLIILLFILSSVLFLIIFLRNYNIYNGYKEQVLELRLQEKYYYPNYFVKTKTLKTLEADIEVAEDDIENIEVLESKLINEIGIKQSNWDEEILNSQKNDSFDIYIDKLNIYYKENLKIYTNKLNNLKNEATNLGINIDNLNINNLSLIEQINTIESEIDKFKEEKSQENKIQENKIHKNIKHDDKIHGTEQKNADDVCKETYINGILFVNKDNCLPRDYNPGGLTMETQNSWNKMVNDAKIDGINLRMISSFRSYDYQVDTYNYWVNLYGEEYASKVSAKPGYSEHQTGMTIDVGGEHGCDLDSCFGSTPEGVWLSQNAYRYGFIIRYPQGKEEITKYEYEPWHIRYVGIDHATAIYNQGLTLEGYLNQI